MFSLTGKSYITLASLAILSALGNYFSLPLFFGVDFVFGSIAVLLVIHLFGVGWGVTVALLASSYTFLLWGHSFAILLYTLEALFIGLVWQRYTHNLLLLEGIFWLCLGLPVIWLLHHVATPLETTQTLLLFFKYLINGIANAAIACLIIIFLPFSKWADLPQPSEHPSLRLILLNLIAALVLLPALIITTISGAQLFEKVKKDIKTDLTTLSKDLITDLTLLHRQHIQLLQKLAQIAAQADLHYSDQLAQQAVRILEFFPEFLNINLTNAQGEVIFNSAIKTNKFNDLNINTVASHAPIQSVLATRQIATFHSTLTQEGTVTPITAHALPIERNGQLIGTVIGYFDVSQTLYRAHALQHTLIHDAQITLTNEQGLIINSTRPDLRPLSPYPLTSATSTTWRTSATYPSFPQQTTHVMQRWRDAVYVQHTPVNETLPITIVIEKPLHSYIDSCQQLYIKQLALISLIALLSLILAMIISRWLVTPLRRLAHITDNLPNRLEKNPIIQWPHSQVSEINSLTNNFKSMAKSLQARFEEIHTVKDSLEQRVQTRTQELLRERALLRNLIDSIPDLICYKDCNSNYLGCNKAFEKFVGFSQAELIGKTDLDVLSNEQANLYREIDKQILTTGKPHTTENWVIYPDGRKRLLHLLKTPFFSPDGHLLGLIGISRDITARKQSEEALHQSQDMLRLVIDNIPQFIFWKDQKGTYLGCNQNFAQIIGINSYQVIVGKTDDDLIKHEPSDGTARFIETLNRCISNEGTPKYQQIESLPLADGTHLWLEINQVPLRDVHGHIIGVLGSFEDITERKQTEEKLRQWVKVLEKSAEAILITDAQTHILQINQAFTQITGYRESEVLGKRPNILRSGKHNIDFYDKMWKSINTQGYWEGEIWDRRKNGEIYPQWLHISVIKDEANEQVTNYLGIFSDLTLRKQTEQRLVYLAHYDDLTGLPNRTLFYERVSRAIYHAQQHSKRVAVMFLDIDGFKYVNDTWGHIVGDLLLKKVANRLTECRCKTDMIARLGGDDFSMVLENVNNTKEVGRFAQNLLKVMQSPFELNGHETFITTSIGISLYPSDSQDVNTLLKHADAAMYRAKEKGKNNYQFFTAQTQKNVHNRLIMDTKLRRALERDELVLHYQPQMQLATGRMVGAEVLLRWQHPEMGLIPPYAFIPLAEETGLIVQIGEWVLRHTCLQQQQWRNNGEPILRLSVNLSSRQFQQDDLIKTVVQILDETHIDATLLELELTESLLMQDIETATKTLHQFKDMGIQLAIDDFGTGYSSLSYLKRFPIDTLKIDQSFVRDIPKDKDDISITKAIIALAHSLRLKVIAEGVETESQQTLLKSIECDEIQGYLIGHPLPADEFLKLVNNKKREKEKGERNA